MSFLVSRRCPDHGKRSSNRRSRPRKGPICRIAPINCCVVEEVSGHTFISYVRENSLEVDKLQRALEASGIQVWRDTADLWPGEDWRAKIRRAIIDNTLVFIACFSSLSVARDKSYQNEELVLAIEQLRLRRPDAL